MKDKNVVTNQNLSGSNLQDGEIALYVSKVMAWMFFAVAITAGTAFYLNSTGVLSNVIYDGSLMFIIILVAQLVVAMLLSFLLRKLPTIIALLLFIAYSVLCGVTLTTFVMMFKMSSLIIAFAATSLILLTFGVLGFVTKKDLTKLGGIVFIGLLGVIVTSLLNIFIFKSDTFATVISALVILFFIGFVAYDIQKIKREYIALRSSGHDRSDKKVRKLTIIGAFSLYLDFINIFTNILSIFGESK